LIKKQRSGSNPGEDWYGPNHQIPDRALSVVLLSVEPLRHIVAGNPSAFQTRVGRSDFTSDFPKRLQPNLIPLSKRLRKVAESDHYCDASQRKDSGLAGGVSIL